ncbi:uncharacterized protein LOC132563347, partial [Ylistrum balloti]|uniref:uncharacterized protein LOC132563347 n=1 Tax=Ylistrum balloti TaxID=509963 RepID=UPI002905B28C
MGIFINGWFPVMKVSKTYGPSPASGIYDLWNNAYTVNEYNDSINAFSFADNTIPYKSSVVDAWTSYYIKAVRLSFIVSGTERAYVVFDAHGTTKWSWFSCDRILYSSWTDLNNDAYQEYCSIQGNAANQQYFLMESSYGTSCATNSGWFSVVERTSGGCSWEQMDSNYPHVVYSDTTTAELNTGMAVADTFTVSVSMDDICDIVVCENGATCLDWGGRYSCVCEGLHYGHLCQNIDGNYTAWTAWTDCSTSCYATGTQSRNRTCTNPTPLGIGQDCTRYGVDYQVQFCIPTHLDICDEYNTGDISENGNYTMVCPSGFYIHVYDAFYGNGTTCSDSTALSDVRTLCHGQTTSCTLIFNYANFGEDPCSSYAYLTNYGSATFHCAKQQLLDDWKGPWRLVFKVPQNTASPAGYSDIMSLYTASGSYNEGNTAAMTDFSASGSIYKSALLDQWGDNMTVNAVKLSVFANGSEVAHVIFNALSSTKLTWFNQANMISSSWHDIVDGNTTTTLDTGGTEKRTFFISSDYSGCANETGWIMMKDYGATTGCTEWDDPSLTRPYIYYSGLGTRVQWSTTDRLEADALAISIIDWHMVFKAVESVTPTGGVSLESLWTGSDTENDLIASAISVTNTPANIYKSSVVENWSDDFTFIDMVKYSYFTAGIEKAWIVFDGVGTTKSTWFADDKILFSKYTDIKTAGKTTVSISGDSTRSFAVIYQSSSCTSTTGWMMLFDYGSSGTCNSFERESNVATKPYFLYSNTDVYGYPQWSSSWDSTNFPKADVMGVFIKGWFPVLKVARGMDITPSTGIYDLWTGTYIMNEYNDSSEAFSFASDTMTYKSSLVDTWTNYYIRAVRVSFFVNGSEQAYVVFDAHGSDKTSWFSCDRILYTSWADLSTYGRKDYCSIAGDFANSRHFAMQSSYGSTCNLHNGWFAVSEAGSGCAWETQASAPFAVYSNITTLGLNNDMAVADVFAVSVSMDNICDIVACENGATCRDWGVTYNCLCEGDHYGWLCQNIDGNYTSWTDWSDCTTTCYAEGTHYRTRTCTNPTPLGIGQDCTRYGEPLEILRCIPTNLDICPEYNTGEIAEETSYYMVCPSDFYIHVYAASYGNGTTCYDANALEDVRTACHMQTDTCNVTFSDTFFSGDPCTAYPGAVVTGSARFYCAKRRELDNFRGPWRLAFKVPAGTAPPAGYADFMALYDASGAYNEFDTAAMTDFSAGGTVYKSTMLDYWGVNTSVSGVKLSVFKDGQEVHYVTFDAVGKGKTDCEGDTWKRNFFMKSDYTTCTNETGWLVLKDYGATDGCSEWDTTTSLPQIWYSQTGVRVQWAYGNKTTADALAIFLMDWHMVFKGVEEVTPEAGTLANLWTLTDTENDNVMTATTITKSPNVAYKSSLVENWSDPFTFIDMVKYGFFTNGIEKAYTIFDGRSTTKTSWFTSSKIRFSKYTDISSVSIGHCSISSDSRRRFLIAHDISTTCSSYKAWMLTQDVGGSTYCAFDNSALLGKNRPNFLYSDGTSYGLPQP